MTEEIKEITKVEGTLVYVSVDQPVKAYVKPGAEPKPDEWKAGVVITDEDFVDELEEYAKKLDTQLSLKKVKRTEFEEIYKCEVPEGEGKNVWVLTLRKSVKLGKTDKDVPEKFRPRVFLETDVANQDITHTHLVGNGSKGILSIDRFDRTQGGSSLYLKNVLVTDLIEYVKEESDYEPGAEFANRKKTTKAESTTEAPKKSTAKKVVKKTEDTDEGAPF
jgi:hypothetical protein